jgi:sirohydrochlorin ferrochelatase
MNTSETFAAWRVEIEAELTIKRQEHAAALVTLADAGSRRAAAIAYRATLHDALTGLSAPVRDYRTGQTTRPQISNALGLRARDEDSSVRSAEVLVIRARNDIKLIVDEIADLELGLRQLDQIENPASATAEAEDTEA